jgi:hypothetical protein
MPASDRRLILLSARFPGLSRMTLWRIEQEPDFPTPIVIRNRRYYDSVELGEWEESRRRLGKTTPKRSTAKAEAETTPQ